MPRTYFRIMVAGLAGFVLLFFVTNEFFKTRVEPHPLGQRWFASFQGLGWIGDNSLFGRKWGDVLYLHPEEGLRRFEFSGEGFNRFECRYPTGVLRSEGECLVTLMGAKRQPFPQEERLREGRFFRPDGTLAGEIHDGDGVETFHTNEGVKVWECVYENTYRQLLKMWHPNGALRMIEHYQDGLRHGAFASYYANGHPKAEGAHHHGKSSGGGADCSAD